MSSCSRVVFQLFYLYHSLSRFSDLNSLGYTISKGLGPCRPLSSWLFVSLPSLFHHLLVWPSSFFSDFWAFIVACIVAVQVVVYVFAVFVEVLVVSIFALGLFFTEFDIVKYVLIVVDVVIVVLLLL